MRPTKGKSSRRPQGSVQDDPEVELAGLRILIVEDMGLIAQELRLMLEEHGCHIVGVAARLDEATTLAKREDLDGVLLDLNLSGQNSYPVADILHARGVPLIFMSGYDSGHLRADCADDAHLQKPFSHEALAEMMLRTFRPEKSA